MSWFLGNKNPRRAHPSESWGLFCLNFISEGLSPFTLPLLNLRYASGSGVGLAASHPCSPSPVIVTPAKAGVYATEARFDGHGSGMLFIKLSEGLSPFTLPALTARREAERCEPKANPKGKGGKPAATMGSGVGCFATSLPSYPRCCRSVC